jgi:tetratricopeptide (TPR) repeat protein
MLLEDLHWHLPLRPLGPEAIRALLRDQLGEDPSVAALPETIHAHTRGNPFFIEEVVQSLVESGHLVGARGAYRLTTPVEGLRVPASVQAVLAARIDRLPERQKEVVQTAAVIGKTFLEALLRRVVASVSKLDDSGLSQALSALAAAEFLFEASLYPQLEYSFKHPLTQEVAQRSQLRGQRIGVHAAVARVLEEMGGNLDERAAEIAQHWAEAEDGARAALWYRRAAEWAALSDAREGLQHWRRVRELAAGLEDERERDELSLQACVEIFSLGWRMGGSDAESDAVFAEGRALAERSGDRRSLARLVGFYGLMRSQRLGSAEDYVRYGEEAAAIAAETGDPALCAGIGTLPAFGHMFAGDGRAVLDWVARVLEDTGSDSALGKEISGYSPRASMFSNRTNALLYLGRLDEAWSAAREAERVAEESGELEVLGWVHYVTAWLAYTCGSSQSVLEHGRRCLEIAEKLDNESSRTLAHAALGYAHLVDAQLAAAREAFQESIAIARDRRSQLAFVPQSLATLAEVHLLLGEGSAALAAAREAIDLGRAGGGRYFEAHAQIALAAALLATEGDPPRVEIEAALERAEELVESIAGQALAPRILEQRGRLAAALADGAASERMLRQALDLYREIGAGGPAERLARELGS